MSTKKTLGGLALASGVWLMSSASAVAMQPGALMMELGPAALAPKGYMAFCERRPEECGADRQAVLANARRVEADRAALLAPPSPPPGSVPATLVIDRQPQSPPLAEADLTPAPEPLSVVIERAPLLTAVAFVDPTRPPADVSPPRPAMSPKLWRLLNRVNGQVNKRIRAVTDAAGYGVDDYWTMPIDERRAFGDCEDFVLEKQRALVAAGIARNALSIAIVTTSWGETHAVLLVNTSQGEFVLDNLNRAITPWNATRYTWRQRELGGDPFTWAMIKTPARAAGA